MLGIEKYTLGPVATNVYLVFDRSINEGVVIDPAWDGAFLAEQITQAELKIQQIWLTHAHFDHFAGLADLLERLNKIQTDPVSVGMHPGDQPLWEGDGGAGMFGIKIKKSSPPSLKFHHGQGLQIGEYTFRVIHAPGHSPGHVMFHCRAEDVLFAGDVIFQRGIGRTDLPGGDFQTLINSIREEVLTLPDQTKICNGHGPETSVGAERSGNPFLV
jgi:glyoxylase-like metal-dependent hydrolase (beta-lactamase superfamily II)